MGESTVVEPGRVPFAFADRHPLAARLADMTPGPALAGLLAGLEPADCDEVALVEVVAAWDRLAAWAAAGQARVVAELCVRARGSQVEHVADDVAARLGQSRRVGEDVVVLAVGLTDHPQVADALSRGRIDARKARVLLTDTEHLGAHVDAVIDAVLRPAEWLTAPQLRTAIRRAELELDAGAAAARHEVACADRCVRLVPARDAMAWIRALLPAADAATVMCALDAAADAAAAAPGDDRTVDQRRADALTSAMRGLLDTGLAPDGTPLPVRQHRRPHLHLTVPTVVGRAGVSVAGEEVRVTGAAELAGYGPLPLAAVSHLLAQASAHVVVLDEVTNTALSPCSSAAHGVGSHGSGVVSHGSGAGSHGSGAGSPRQTGAPRSLPASVPATPGYRPDADLARRVVDRDVTCTFPGCQVAATRCDIDHIEPYDPTRPAADQTRAANLHALCRRHHRLKTAGLWRVTRDPATGLTTWTAPTGHIYARAPVPTVVVRATSPPAATTF